MNSDSLHFSFMQMCKPSATEITEEKSPRGLHLQGWRKKRERQAIHEETLRMNTGSLAKALTEN